MYSNEELIELKKEVEKINDKIDKLLERDYTICLFDNNNISDIPKACQYCPNHPLNGGDGICNCTLGQPKITY